jgi:hypothetical protein
MQWYDYDGWNYLPDEVYMGYEPNWDHIYVDMTATGDRRVRTSLECDGGLSRGHELPWVSWLWHRNMQNWELLDEPFRTSEGDDKVGQLTGGYY